MVYFGISAIYGTLLAFIYKKSNLPMENCFE
jgi:hypothetical protein